MIRERIILSDLGSNIESIKKVISNYDTLKEMLNNEDKYDDLDLRSQLIEMKHYTKLAKNNLIELIENIDDVNDC